MGGYVGYLKVRPGPPQEAAQAFSPASPAGPEDMMPGRIPGQPRASEQLSSSRDISINLRLRSLYGYVI